jgi:hypothetical protein
MFFFASQVTMAQSNTSSVFRFLDVTPTARTAGLGGNHAGLYNADFSLIHINPAYLSRANSGSVSASYLNFFSDANMGLTSGAYTFEKAGTFGAAIRYVGYGEFDQWDENGNSLGTFNPGDIAITGAYSLEIAKNLRAGAAMDFIHASYAQYKSSAVAFSGGMFYQDTTNHFSAGISIRNMGAQITTFADEREPLPLDVSIGITKKPEAFPFQLSLTLKKLNDWDLRVVGETEKPSLIDNTFRHIIFGGETYLGENVNVRLGYDHYLHELTQTGQDFDLAGVAFGVGFNIKGITIDLSRSSYSRLGGITRLSLKTDLN